MSEQLKKFFVDIDECICHTPKIDGVNRYDLSQPYQERIDMINRLYDKGHEIIYWTSRGASTGQDWLDFTRKQLNSWGCKADLIKVGKPQYDIFICDKAFNSNEFFPELHQEYH